MAYTNDVSACSNDLNPGAVSIGIKINSSESYHLPSTLTKILRKLKVLMIVPKVGDTVQDSINSGKFVLAKYPS